MGVRKRMREEVSFRNVSASKTMKLDLSTENEVIEQLCKKALPP